MIAIPNHLIDELSEENPDALLADGFHAACIGYTANQHHPAVAVYDLQKCCDILVESGMAQDEAMEYLSYYTLGAYVGENGPLFVRTQ